MNPLIRTVMRFPPEAKELMLAAVFNCGITTVQEAELEKEDLGDTLICYFETSKEAEELKEGVSSFLQDIESSVAPSFDIEAIEPLDWVNEWKKFVRPVNIQNKLLICPTDEEVELLEGQECIRLDPQLAFGTGAHETTRLCLELLVDRLKEKPVSSFLDVGCGSGILSIAASRLGVPKVQGIDNKERAVVVAKANVERNKAENVQISDTPLSEVEGTFDLVCANIISSILKELWSDLKLKTNKGGCILLSGVLLEEEEDFLNALSDPPLEVRRDGEWIAVVISL